MSDLSQLFSIKKNSFTWLASSHCYVNQPTIWFETVVLHFYITYVLFILQDLVLAV